LRQFAGGNLAAQLQGHRLQQRSQQRHRLEILHFQDVAKEVVVGNGAHDFGRILAGDRLGVTAKTEHPGQQFTHSRKIMLGRQLGERDGIQQEFPLASGQRFFDRFSQFKTEGAGDQQLGEGEIFMLDFQRQANAFHPLGFIENHQPPPPHEPAQFLQLGFAQQPLHFRQVAGDVTGLVGVGVKDGFGQGGLANLPGAKQNDRLAFEQDRFDLAMDQARNIHNSAGQPAEFLIKLPVNQQNYHFHFIPLIGN
jgi:hypothetical protein